MNTITTAAPRCPQQPVLRARRFANAGMLFAISIAIFVVAAASAQAAPYVIDPLFNAGAVKVDRFAGTSNANYHGRKSVRMPNGDVVVAGSVPAYGQLDGVSTNIGLVRYTPQGARVPWPTAGSFGFFNNEYVIWPNSSTTAYFGRITSVVDMLLIRSRICVLAAYQTGAERFFGVECFRSDGLKLGSYPHFVVGYNQDPVGVAMYDTGAGFKVVVASRKENSNPNGPIDGCYDGGNDCVILTQYNVTDAPGASSDGLWYEDTVFGQPWAGGGAGSVSVQSIAIGTRGDLEPYIYTASTLTHNGIQRVRIHKWDSAGNPIQTINPVFRGVSNRAEHNPIVTVEQVPGSSAYHYVYIAASVDEQCQPGTGVAKYASTGFSASGFGTSGVLMMGGNDSAWETQDCAFAVAATPLAMTVADGVLAIAGYGLLYYEPSNYEPDKSGLLGILRKDNGVQLSLRGYAMYSNQWIGSTSFYGVTATGNGAFMLSGDADESGDGAKLMFGSARIGPPDKIFANGYD
jgi:hypothetical protein